MTKAQNGQIVSNAPSDKGKSKADDGGSKGLSLGAKVGIGAGVAALLGGLAFALKKLVFKK